MMRRPCFLNSSFCSPKSLRDQPISLAATLISSLLVEVWWVLCRSTMSALEIHDQVIDGVALTTTIFGFAVVVAEVQSHLAGEAGGVESGVESDVDSP